MKTILATILLSLACAAQADQQKSVETESKLTTQLLGFFMSQDVGFYGGIHQGTEVYGGEIECAPPVGQQNEESMQCYVRPHAGFSRLEGRVTAAVPANLATELIEVMKNARLTYLIGNGEGVASAYGAKIYCFENSGTIDENGAPYPNSCTLSSAL
jgi:hypothetical protein